ncbi:AAA family ATPase [Rhodococcus erythropolis]|uniref:AAA family ATPase n=1 Tax=Rhodococcus erythropolis TaxID=1833 RepID=UPI001C9AB611|nr:AAA family ATPase [Rhodococcus erythropolis]MBY6384068.1 AAA family ATPase [Rhodococcus erythropolis]
MNTTDRVLIRRFLELQYGTDKGTAWIGAGNQADHAETPFLWPDQADEIVEYVATTNEAGNEVWFAAHPSYSKAPKPQGQGRAMGMSVKRRRLHVDIDRALTAEDTAKLTELQAWLVYSGTPGHVHAYIELNRSVDVGMYHKFEDWLVTYFDSDTAVCRDNGLLRIPGTINRKPGAGAVTWDADVSADVSQRRRWAPEDLAAFIGLDLSVAPQVTAQVASSAPIVAAPVSQVPQAVQYVLHNPKLKSDGTWDRSAMLAKIVNAAASAGLTIAQTLGIALSRAELASKGESWIRADVPRLWTKFGGDSLGDEENRKQMQDEENTAALMGGQLDAFATKGSSPPAQPRVNPIRARALSLRGLSTLTPAEFLVEGFLYQNTLVQLSAEPGSFKTFFALAMSCALASKKTEWLGYRVKSCPVLYVAAEGANGMLARVEAWCQTESTGDTKVTVDDLNLTFYPEAVQLDDPQQMKDLEEFVAEEGFGLVVIDTRARCTTGLEENSATEQGKAIAAAEKLRSHTGATIMMVHHSARAGAGAASAGRGSNAWDGAVWSDLRSKSRDLTLDITCAKHKDVESGCTHSFSMLPIVLPTGQTTLVVGKAGEFVPDRKKVDMAAIARLMDVLDAEAERTGMTAKHIGESLGVSKSTASRTVKQAIELGMVTEIGTGRYPHYGRNPEFSETP